MKKSELLNQIEELRAEVADLKARVYWLESRPYPTYAWDWYRWPYGYWWTTGTTASSAINIYQGHKDSKSEYMQAADDALAKWEGIH